MSVSRKRHCDAYVVARAIASARACRIDDVVNANESESERASSDDVRAYASASERRIYALVQEI